MGRLQPVTIIDVFGYAAGLLTTISCVPQVVQSWRTRSVHDLSRAMLVILNLGIVCWIVYGLHEGNWPILITNVISLVPWSSLLWLKLREGR